MRLTLEKGEKMSAERKAGGFEIVSEAGGRCCLVESMGNCER